MIIEKKTIINGEYLKLVNGKGENVFLRKSLIAEIVDKGTSGYLITMSGMGSPECFINANGLANIWEVDNFLLVSGDIDKEMMLRRRMVELSEELGNVGVPVEGIVGIPQTPTSETMIGGVKAENSNDSQVTNGKVNKGKVETKKTNDDDIISDLR